MWHDWPMTADDVQRWLDAYIAAWASYDEAEITALFTDDCRVPLRPVRDPLVGSAADRRRLAEGTETRRDRGRRSTDAFAVDGDRAVAVGETRYPQEGRRYENLYVLEFAADGRCRSFTEWFFLERTRS